MPSVYYFDHIFDTLLQRPVQGLSNFKNCNSSNKML